jgi:shikimate dehydrogenase
MANYGLIGYPLSHSFSQSYFTEKFNNQKLNHNYLNLSLSSLEQLKAEVSKANLEGFNVTIPYKREIFPFLDNIDPIAQSIGAVNCVKIDSNGWTGYNTDVIGFRDTIKPLMLTHFKYYEPCLILGTGGASLAVEDVLKELGHTIDFASRESKKGIPYNELKGKLDNYGLIINTTPLGTFPDVDSCPDLNYEEINANHLCYDLVYNPTKSEFLKRSEQSGARIKNGLEMLEIQAEESWNIWSDSI